MEYKKLIEKYGNPDADGDGILDVKWAAENLAVFPLPFPMVLSWNTAKEVTKIQAHRLVGTRIIAALRHMATFKGEEYLRENHLDRWGGCFNFRLVRGGTTPSKHSWGVAVDINPAIGRLGNKADAAAYPRFIIDAFEVEGFLWGGRWDRADAMHFEVKE